MRRTTTILVGLGVLPVVLAGAWHAHVLTTSATARPRLDASQTCDDSQSLSALKLCVASKLKHDENIMNRAVIRAEKYFRKQLVEGAQSDFQAYARSECLVASSLNYGGSEYPLLVSRCKIKLVLARIQQLNADIRYAQQLANG
jgi:uncharacterized protein YecT (DUF1311 family)